ncbi:MAG: hypothetical protein KDA85_21505 [Planctomycetaceae bacterium]|nr:hypothetical protein [Planctomycetaceae bacterium]
MMLLRRHIATTSAVATLLLLSVGGCGPAETVREFVEVSGTVTFQQQPVEEGNVSFEDAESGLSGTAPLESGGNFDVELVAGNYRVWIEPPIIVTDSGPESEPGEDYKDVANIPEKYRNPETSGLTLTVEGPTDAVQFEMTR